MQHNRLIDACGSGIDVDAFFENIGVTQARIVEIEANPGAVSLQQVMQVLQALGAGLVIRDGMPEAATRQAAESPAPYAAKQGEW